MPAESSGGYCNADGTDMTPLFDAAKKYLFLEVFYVLLLSFTAVEFR